MSIDRPGIQLSFKGHSDDYLEAKWKKCVECGVKNANFYWMTDDETRRRVVRFGVSHSEPRGDKHKLLRNCVIHSGKKEKKTLSNVEHSTVSFDSRLEMMNLTLKCLCECTLWSKAEKRKKMLQEVTQVARCRKKPKSSRLRRLFVLRASAVLTPTMAKNSNWLSAFWIH